MCAWAQLNHRTLPFLPHLSAPSFANLQFGDRVQRASELLEQWLRPKLMAFEAADCEWAQAMMVAEWAVQLGAVGSGWLLPVW